MANGGEHVFLSIIEQILDNNKKVFVVCNSKQAPLNYRKGSNVGIVVVYDLRVLDFYKDILGTIIETKELSLENARILNKQLGHNTIWAFPEHIQLEPYQLWC